MRARVMHRQRTPTHTLKKQQPANHTTSWKCLRFIVQSAPVWFFFFKLKTEWFDRRRWDESIFRTMLTLILALWLHIFFKPAVLSKSNHEYWSRSTVEMCLHNVAPLLTTKSNQAYSPDLILLIYFSSNLKSIKHIYHFTEGCFSPGHIWLPSICSGVLNPSLRLYFLCYQQSALDWLDAISFALCRLFGSSPAILCFCCVSMLTTGTALVSQQLKTKTKNIFKALPNSKSSHFEYYRLLKNLFSL